MSNDFVGADDHIRPRDGKATTNPKPVGADDHIRPSDGKAVANPVMTKEA